MENNGDTIVVTGETAAAGKHSLKIIDAPGLRNEFNPHYVYAPKTQRRNDAKLAHSTESTLSAAERAQSLP